MLQLWVDQPGERDEVGDEPDGRARTWSTSCPPASMPPGFLPVLQAYDYAGDEVTLVHADDTRLWRMAVFDVLINNADRKGGHILSGVDGQVYGVDHGVSLHVEDKLRTVLWGWAGKPVDDQTWKRSRDCVDSCETAWAMRWVSTSRNVRSPLCGPERLRCLTIR